MGGTSAEDLKHVRITRVDESMPMGGWLRAHGLPCQGLYVDAAPRRGARALRAMASTVTTRSFLLRCEGPDDARAAASWGAGSQEPIDDLEYHYLVPLVMTFN